MRAARALYTAWFLVWLPAYAAHFGPQFLLWMCCVGNVLVLAGLWLGRPLLVSMAAVAVLVPQGLWCADLAARLLGGAHLTGVTRYLFDAASPLHVRALSLFHLWMPALLVWALRREGYRPAAGPCVLALAALLFPLCYWGFDPRLQTNDALFPLVDGAPFDRDFNLNWVHGFYDRPGPLPGAWNLARALAGYAVGALLPAHLALARLFPTAAASRRMAGHVL